MDHPNQIDHEHVENYLLSGKAFVTVKNTAPKPPPNPAPENYVHPANSYHFHIKRAVSKLTGELKNYWNVYYNKDKIGWIDVNRLFRAAEGDRAQKLYAAPLFFFQNVWIELRAGTLPSRIEFWHTGKCGHCSRRLTDPESIKMGVGPECRKKLGI